MRVANRANTPIRDITLLSKYKEVIELYTMFVINSSASIKYKIKTQHSGTNDAAI